MPNGATIIAKPVKISSYFQENIFLISVLIFVILIIIYRILMANKQYTIISYYNFIKIKIYLNLKIF